MNVIKFIPLTKQEQNAINRLIKHLIKIRESK